ncbi:TPA: IS30 family transposase [Streptococcus pneumoniae]|nr:IS30 family transposase [Streptococcus pneumoniae]HEU8001536.1 IS30 family transposase [Streptococcus pneumoniae]HEU8039593.1 IS30 family transposase [Streptococcus pneumoniae]HEU8045740.1 IS30 family transposase [Streptococcus pneumoniae]HEU8047862.1 IS30 family transposase [Streptococcus pneumoniae]
MIVSLKTKSRKAKDMAESIQGWLAQFLVNLFKSITFDCGKKFSKWKDISNHHDSESFFANLGCPRQRCLNEHSNRLLRCHDLPKQTDFNEVSQEF